MGRRTERAAQEAAMQASEAGRVLREARNKPEESVEPQPEARKPDAPRPPSRNEPRELAMEEVVNRHHETSGIKDEPEVKEEPKVEPKPEPKADPKVEAQKEEPKAEESAVEPVVEAPKTVRVKVDGEEYEAPQSEIDEYGGVKAYQIAKAAEKRTEKANQLVAETRQQQAALVQYFQQLAQQTQPPKVTPDQLIAQKIDIIRYGSPEESAAAMREVLDSAVSANRIDPRELEQRIVLRSKLDRAAERFRTEFADVMANPMLAQLAAIEEQKRLNSLTSMPTDFYDLYRGIGNELRSLVSPRAIPAQTQAAPTTGNTSPETAGNTSQPTSEKEARKASGNVVSLPTASTRAAAPEEEKPGTPEEERAKALNAMKRSRGIPTG